MSAAGGVLAVMDRYGFKCGDPESDCSKARATVEAMAGALRAYRRAGFGNSTDFYAQAEAARLADAALSRYHGSAAPAGGGDEVAGDLLRSMKEDGYTPLQIAVLGSIYRRLASAGSASCAECGAALEEVRPGKHQHPTCSQHPSAGSAPAPSAVPEGFALVPVEPTEAMVAAYTALDYTDLVEFNHYGGMTGWDMTVTEDGALNAWRAMLAAAPTPEQQR